jgi:hypothetical protein
MKGVIFCLLEKLVVARGGRGAWEAVVRQTRLKTADGNFIRPAIYPDEDLYALMDTASVLTGEPVGDLYRAFGRATFFEHASAYPASMPAGIRAKAFLMSVDRMMRVEIQKLQPGAHLPYFVYEDLAPDRLVMNYNSRRGLCDLVAGLIDGVSDHLGEEITQAHTQCQRDGHPHCRFELRFGARRPDGLAQGGGCT